MRLTEHGQILPFPTSIVTSITLHVLEACTKPPDLPDQLLNLHPTSCLSLVSTEDPSTSGMIDGALTHLRTYLRIVSQDGPVHFEYKHNVSAGGIDSQGLGVQDVGI